MGQKYFSLGEERCRSVCNTNKYLQNLNANDSRFIARICRDMNSEMNIPVH